MEPSEPAFKFGDEVTVGNDPSIRVVVVQEKNIVYHVAKPMKPNSIIGSVISGASAEYIRPIPAKPTLEQKIAEALEEAHEFGKNHPGNPFGYEHLVSRIKAAIEEERKHA